MLPAATKWKAFFNRQAGNRMYLQEGDVVEATIAPDALARPADQHREGPHMNDRRSAPVRRRPSPSPSRTRSGPTTPLRGPDDDRGPAALDAGIPETTYDVLRRAARLWPDRTAITTMPEAARWQDGASRTYAELLADVTRTANLLHSLGVRRGDAVALAPNGAELITALLASQVAGVAALINAGLSAEHIVELLKRSGPGCSCAPDRGSTPAVDPRVDGRRRRRHRSPVLGPVGPEPVGHPDATRVVFLAEAAAAQPAAAFQGEPPRADDIAALFHTGGTTGTPKLAAHTHANEVVDAGPSPRSRSSTTTRSSSPDCPLPRERARRHAAGSAASRPVDGVGGSRGLPRSCALPGSGASSSTTGRRDEAVPTTYAVLARCPVDADISSLRVAMVGASALPPGCGATSRPRPACRCSRGTASPRGPVRAFATSSAITARGRSVSGCRTSA